MRATALPLTSITRGHVPHEAVAIAVIVQAVADLDHPRGPTRASAKVFLSGSTGLLLWCEVLQIDPELIVRRARVLLEAPSPPENESPGR